jgi:hypothetical protein
MFPAAAIPTPLGPPIIAIFRCQNGNWIYWSNNFIPYTFGTCNNSSPYFL